MGWFVEYIFMKEVQKTTKSTIYCVVVYQFILHLAHEINVFSCRERHIHIYINGSGDHWRKMGNLRVFEV